MTRKSFLKGAALAALITAGATAAQAQPYGPGMMGPGYGQPYGPGNAQPDGPGYGQPYGPGMMGPGRGQPYGPGMGPRFGMRGPGFQHPCGPGGPGYAQQTDLNLTVDQVRAQMERWIAFQNNPNIKVGEIKEKDAGTITAEIVTKKENALVQRFEVDRKTGFYRPNAG